MGNVKGWRKVDELLWQSRLLFFWGGVGVGGDWVASSFYKSCQMPQCQQLIEEDEFLEKGRFWCICTHVTGFLLCLERAVMQCFSLSLDWSLLASPHSAYGTKTQCPFFFACVCARTVWMKISWWSPSGIVCTLNMSHLLDRANVTDYLDSSGVERLTNNQVEGKGKCSCDTEN